MLGWSMGIPLFFGALTVAILSLILLLNYQDKIILKLALVVAFMASVSILNG